jgi:hypothetical protein
MIFLKNSNIRGKINQLIAILFKQKKKKRKKNKFNFEKREKTRE